MSLLPRNEVPMVDFHLTNCSRMVRHMQHKQPDSTNLVNMMSSDEDSTFDGLGDIPRGGESGFVDYFDNDIETLLVTTVTTVTTLWIC